ncbi:MAG: NADH-quinone oxidoreductase subunit H [Cyclobacteriaceae bacterium]
MITFLFYLPFLLLFVVFAVYGERKIAAFMQDRYGPHYVGPKGTLQSIADLLKGLQKENIVPAAADRFIFLHAPLVMFVFIFAGYSILPLNSEVDGAIVQSGIFILLAIVSLDVMGVMMAGWGSNNKYSIYGALRSAAQIVSYEIPLGLTVLCVVMTAQSLDLQEIIRQQGPLSQEDNFFLGIKSLEVGGVGGFISWNVFRNPFLLIVFLLFYIAGLAESNRAPFDLPESESELVGGYHTEYSGFRFLVFMLAEYAMLLLVCIFGVALFLGGWYSPLPNFGGLTLADWTNGPIWGTFWLLSKAMVLVFIAVWIRWTYPRLRVDQLMSLSWKYLTPAALLLVFICGIWRLWMV